MQMVMQKWQKVNINVKSNDIPLGRLLHISTIFFNCKFSFIYSGFGLICYLVAQKTKKEMSGILNFLYYFFSHLNLTNQ